MAKKKMTCPISGGPCVECALYRGRHYFLCFSKHYNESSRNFQHLDEQEFKATLKALGSEHNTFGMPDVIKKCPSWITDVEDLIERSGG